MTRLLAAVSAAVLAAFFALAPGAHAQTKLPSVDGNTVIDQCHLPGTVQFQNCTVGQIGAWVAGGGGGPGMTTTAGNAVLPDAVQNIGAQPIASAPSDFTKWASPGTKVISLGMSGQYDESQIAGPAPIQYNGQFYVFYGGWNESNTGVIGLYTGYDLASLTKVGAVLQPTPAAWDSTYVGAPGPYVENGICYMYYYGSAASGFEAPPANIGVATSTDGCVTLTKYAGNPILSVGAGGAWDNNTLYRPYMVKWKGTYYLFYNARNSSIEQIGYATAASPLGPFTKYAGNPIMTVGAEGAWDNQRIGDPQIIPFNGGFEMIYYGAQSGTTGFSGLAYATALSGPWTKYPNNPLVFSGFATTTADGGLRTRVIQSGGRWLGLFDDGNTGIYTAYATPSPERGVFSGYDKNSKMQFGNAQPPATSTDSFAMFGSETSSKNMIIGVGKLNTGTGFLGNNGTDTILATQGTDIQLNYSCNISAADILGSCFSGLRVQQSGAFTPGLLMSRTGESTNGNIFSQFFAPDLTNGSRLTMGIGKAASSGGEAYFGFIPNAAANQSLATIGLWGFDDILQVRGDGALITQGTVTKTTGTCTVLPTVKNGLIASC